MKNAAKVIPIVSPDDDRLIEYRCLRENRLLGPMVGAPHGVFIAEGEKVVKLLITQSIYRTRSLLIAEQRASLAEELASLVGPDVPVYVAHRAVMDEIVGFPIHRGVLASGLRGRELGLDETLRDARACLVLESLANHDNVGGILRLAAALGGCASDGKPTCPLVIDRASCDPLYRKAIRVSMGHALCVPFAKVDSVAGTVGRIAELGFTPVALTTEADATPIESLGEVVRPALMLGAEGDGLTAAAQSLAQVRCRIPMSPGVDSLNVVTAAAIALSRLVKPV